MDAWLTPDTPPSDFICRRLLIPNNVEWIAIVTGALNELIYAYNFETYGSYTPEETAAKFQTMFDQFSLAGGCHMIGEVFAWASDIVMPPGFDTGDVLLCDGAEIAIADYPDLYDIIQEIYIQGGYPSSGHFKIPLMLARMPIGSNNEPSNPWAVGEYGGAVEKALSTAELPAHAHTESVAAASVGAAIVGVPVPSAVPSIGSTGSTGSGQAFSIMQPYVVMGWYIQAR